MKTVKRLLIPIMFILAFSMLSTSVSAKIDGYFMASFYGEASGYCNVYDEHPPVTPIASGKGRAHVRGLTVILRQGLTVHPFPIPPDPYFWYSAHYAVDPNIRIWTRGTSMTVSWNNKKLTVWMWPSTTYGGFNDTEDTFGLWGLRFFGYCQGESGLEFVGGVACVCCGFHPVVKVSFLSVRLEIGEPGQWLIFMWVDSPVPVISAEYVAQRISHSVTVWGPIPWHPSGP